MSSEIDFIRAIQYANQGVVITDPNLPDNPIVYVNPAFEVLTGYSKDEVLGKNCRFLQGDSRDQVAVAALGKALKEHQHVRVEVRNFRKDGTEFWNELTIAPVFDKSGKVVNFVGFQQDVTDRRVALDELRARNETLEHYSEELESKAARQKSIDDRIEELLRQSGLGKE